MKRFTGLFLRYLLMVNVLLLIVGVVGYWKFGSVERAFEASRGYQRIVVEDRIDLGVIQAQKIVKVPIRLKNSNDRKIRILGFEPTCGFQTQEEFPFVLEPSEERILQFQMMAPARSGSYPARMSFYTSNPLHPKELLRFQSEVVSLASQD